MNTKLRVLILVCAGFVVGMLTDRADAAVQFSITGAEFTNLVGANEAFKWSVTPAATPLVLDSIEVGETTDAFTYGTFNTSDFGLDVWDLLDNNDRFNVNLQVEPPDPAASFGSVGRPDAALEFSWSWRDGVRVIDFVDVNFDNTPIVMSADGVTYAVTFLDTARLFANGSLDLQAQITLLSQAVPEPAAIFVWTVLGLTFGVGIHRSRSKRRKS